MPCTLPPLWAAFCNSCRLVPDCCHRPPRRRPWCTASPWSQTKKLWIMMTYEYALAKKCHFNEIIQVPPCYVIPSSCRTWRCLYSCTGTIPPSSRGNSIPPPDKLASSRCTLPASIHGRTGRSRPRTVCPCTLLASSLCGCASPWILSNLSKGR